MIKKILKQIDWVDFFFPFIKDIQELNRASDPLGDIIRNNMDLISKPEELKKVMNQIHNTN